MAPDVSPRRRPGPAARAPADRARAVRRRARRRRRRSSCRARRTGSTRASSPTSRRTRRYAVDPRRAAVGRARRAGHELGHVAGVHRARDAASLDWMVELLDLPERFRNDQPEPGAGVIQGSASEATLVAILAARWRATGGRRQPRRRHLTARRLRHRPGPLEHREGAADRRHRHRPDAHRRPRRRASPCGPTRSPRRSPPTGPPGWCRSSCAPPAARRRRWPSTRRPSIAADLSADAGAWLHVDAAMSGIAALVPELRWVNDGARRRRQLLHEPAQVDGHQLRLRPVLDGRPRRRCSAR